MEIEQLTFLGGAVKFVNHALRSHSLKGKVAIAVDGRAGQLPGLVAH